MTIITLTSDFGTADGFVGVMKGVILSIAPTARLIDLSHEVPPQDVRQGAYLLARCVPYFPPGTVHLAVVDPGVGTTRRALLVATPSAFYVGPDNGLFTLPLQEPGATAYVLDRSAYWRPEISQTFHGRDIFAPVAAHLAAGLSPRQLGSPIHDTPMRLALPEPQRVSGGVLRGQVVLVDRFGNLITDIPGAWLAGSAWRVEIAGLVIEHLVHSYGEAEPGAPVALVSSGGTLEIALRDGSAARQLAAGPGTPVVVQPT